MGLVYILNTIRSFHTIFIRCYLFIIFCYILGCRFVRRDGFASNLNVCVLVLMAWKNKLLWVFWLVSCYDECNHTISMGSIHV